MEIEQTSPNKPNFLAVVLLACAVVLIFFVVAYFFVDFDGGHLTFKSHRAHPTSQLVLPAVPSSPAAPNAYLESPA